MFFTKAVQVCVDAGLCMDVGVAYTIKIYLPDFCIFGS